MGNTAESKFESSLTALEQIVTQLESGELPLERALELFEEGVGLARRCQSQLEDAERKVELLLREHGVIKTVPFDPSKEESPPASNDVDISLKQAVTKPVKAEIAGRDDVIPF